MKNWGREGIEHSSSDDGEWNSHKHAILEHSSACVWTNLRISGSFQSQSPELVTFKSNMSRTQQDPERHLSAIMHIC